MAKITRYGGNFKAFGSDATGTERTVFGSTTQTDDLTTNLGAEYQRGWGVLPSGQKPPKQYFNGALFGTSQAVAYLHQAGVAEWNGEQEYHAGSITNRNGQIFVCLKNDHVSASAPETDSTNWRLDDGSVATISALLNRTTVGTVNVLNYHTGLEGGGGVFYWDAAKPKTSHNGGTVIDPLRTFPADWTNQTQVAAWFSAGTTGAGCWVREVQSDSISVDAFGAKATGDDSLSISQACLTSGCQVIIPYGKSYKVTQTIQFSQLIINGRLYSDSSSNFFILEALHDNASLSGTGKIEITTFPSLVMGVKVAHDNAVVRDIEIQGFNEAGVWAGSCKNLLVENCVIHSSQTATSSYGIYLQACIDACVRNNRVSYMSYAGINTSACLNSEIAGNTVEYVKYFGIKGGYGFVGSLTADVTPTTNTFSVPIDAPVSEGHALLVCQSSTYSENVVVLSVNSGVGYKTITVEDLTFIPSAGAIYEIVDTGALIDSNSIQYVGDNGMDLNIMYGAVITNNDIYRTGFYDWIGGADPRALQSGIWIGADPQTYATVQYTCFRSEKINVSNNRTTRTRGSGIQLFSLLKDVWVENNIVEDFGEINTDTSSGINVNGLNYGVMSSALINGNAVKNVRSTSAGIKVGFNASTKIQDNTVFANDPLVILDAQHGLIVEGNVLQSSNTGSAAAITLINSVVAFYGLSISYNNLFVPAAATGKVGISLTGTLGSLELIANNQLGNISPSNLFVVGGVSNVSEGRKVTAYSVNTGNANLRQYVVNTTTPATTGNDQLLISAASLPCAIADIKQISASIDLASGGFAMPMRMAGDTYDYYVYKDPNRIAINVIGADAASKPITLLLTCY